MLVSGRGTGVCSSPMTQHAFNEQRKWQIWPAWYDICTNFGMVDPIAIMFAANNMFKDILLKMYQEYVAAGTMQLAAMRK